MIADLVRAAWRMKRVQTDPEVSVVLDALLEGRDVADLTSERVVVEEPATSDELTAVLWELAPGERITEVERFAGQRVRRPLTVVSCVECPTENSGVHSFPMVFHLGNVTFERSGILSAIDIHDERGVLIARHANPTTQYVRAGETHAMRDIPCPRELTREVRDVRRSIEMCMRARYHVDGDVLEFGLGMLHGEVITQMAVRIAELGATIESVDIRANGDVNWVGRLPAHLDKISIDAKIDI